MIYEFRTNIVVPPNVDMANPGPGQFPVAVDQLGQVQGGNTNILTGIRQAYHEDIEEFVLPGFRALDEAMKLYWSGMRVPTKDSYRFCRIKVAGGDKSLLVWRDDLFNGRVRVPVASLSRNKHEFNKDRYSPPIHPMVIKYPSKRGDRAVLVMRPVPYLVDYTLSIWTEHKRDIEYILYQTITRFNPLAVFHMFDGRMQGDVTLRFGGATDTSDKEAAFDQHRLIKYEVSMTAESWLPLPERMIPTVLGTVISIKSEDGTMLAGYRGSIPI